MNYHKGRFTSFKESVTLDIVRHDFDKLKWKFIQICFKNNNNQNNWNNLLRDYYKLEGALFNIFLNKLRYIK